MTPSDQHADQQLTRRQLREIRMTGATPVVSPEAAAEALAQSIATQSEAAASEVPVVETPAEPEPPAAAPLHLPRAAEPIAEAPAPAADASVDLSSRARTRRQARDQERIRTNSIQVVAPEATPPILPFGEPAPAPADPASSPTVTSLFSANSAPTAAEPAPMITPGTSVFSGAPAAEAVADSALSDVAADVSLFAPRAAEPVVEESVVDGSVADESAVDESVVDDASTGEDALEVPDAPVANVPSAESALADEVSDASEALWAPRSATGATTVSPVAPVAPAESLADSLAPADTAESDAEPIVRTDFGAGLLSQGESFDDLLTRSSTSSGSAGSASTLILPEDLSMSPLTAPVTSTGQVILTGTFSLPEGLGSQGHAPGVADGKEVDAVLIDGELAPQSSPTPIAATAAVSQAKTPVEMIRPLTPEKSSKLVVALAITAGVLALAAIGFTIYVVSTGKF